MEYLILGSLFLLPVFYVLIQYNGLIALQNHIRESWSDVDTELKRRHDLIPNLVATVKGYAAHEQAVLGRLAELRSQSQSLHDPAKLGPVEQEIGRQVQRVLAVVENYPQLKADAHFLSLQKELANTEDRIQAARRFYNANVRDYLNKCQMFPSSLVAALFRFAPEAYFSAEPAARETPSVRLD